MKKIYLLNDIGNGLVKLQESITNNNQFVVPVDKNLNLYDSYLCCFVKGNKKYTIEFTPKNSSLLVGNFNNIPYYFSIDRLSNPLVYVGKADFEESESIFLIVYPEFDGLIVHKKELLSIL